MRANAIVSLLLGVVAFQLSCLMAGLAYGFIYQFEMESSLIDPDSCMAVFGAIDFGKVLVTAFSVGLVFYNIPLLILRGCCSPQRSWVWFAGTIGITSAISLFWFAMPEPLYGCVVPETPIADQVLWPLFGLASFTYWVLWRLKRKFVGYP